jgi:hypothetical protein
LSTYKRKIIAGQVGVQSNSAKDRGKLEVVLGVRLTWDFTDIQLFLLCPLCHYVRILNTRRLPGTNRSALLASSPHSSELPDRLHPTLLISSIQETYKLPICIRHNLPSNQPRTVNMSTSNAPTKMKALVYRDANQVEVVEKDIPTPGPGEVVVKVTTSGLW